MKVSVLQENLTEALHISSRFVSNKAQLPVLSNILISADKNKLLISATNLELSISLNVGAKVEEDGGITVPSRFITDLIGNLPSGTISLQAEKEQLKIERENFNSTLAGMNTSDFPSIPATLDKDSASLPGKEFIDALAQVLFAVSTDETRPVLTGVLLIFKEKEVVLVSTDGFRLSQKKLPFPSEKKVFAEQKLILPKSALTELSRLGGESEKIEFSFSKEESRIIFGIDSIVLTSRTIGGEFPDFEKIIPKTSSIKINLDKEEFLRGVKLASVFARESANVTKLNIGGDFVEIEAESSKSGSQKNRVDSKVEGDVEKGLTIAFNYRFLEEFLGVVSGEDVEIELGDSNSPGIFKDPKDKDFLHLIMPVRLTS